MQFIPARSIPIPTTVGPELYKLLGATVNWPTPPTTVEEWRAYRKKNLVAKKEFPLAVAEIRDRLGVTITTELIGGVRCYIATPKEIRAENRDRLIVNLHPGGWMVACDDCGCCEAVIAAGLIGIKVIDIDYRLLPNHPFPAAMDDVMAVWKAITGDVKAGNVAVLGSSAGATMALAMVQRAKREGLSLPGAVMSDSPPADLSKSGDTYFTNEGIDNQIGSYEGWFAAIAKLYADGRDLDDPLLSPVYGEFGDFPPTFLVSGTRDLYLSNTVRVHRKLLQADVPAQLVVQEAHAHGFTLLGAMHGAPEDLELYSYVASFFDTHLGR